MKRKYLFLVFVAAWLISGCKQEILEPEQMIQGRFALDDGSGLTSEYIDFNNGHLTVYTSTTYPLAEGKIWHTDGKTFKDTRASYSIQDGNLQTSAPSLSGPVELKDGILTIGNKKYVAMTGFDVNPYSKIIVERKNTFPYTEQDISIPFSIERSIPAGQATVSSNSAWITNPQVGDGVITGHLSVTNTNRTGSIAISYTHADAVTVQISQAPSTFIRPASESLTLDYVASTPALDYTIENPVSTSVLTATTSATWISDIQISGTQVTFKVSENNTGVNRSTTLLLKYAGARDVSISVTQKWAASGISMTPSTQTVDYTGGSFNFNYAVANPRANTSVTAASQANWITDVKLVGTNVSYKVSKNNSSAQRTGKIKLTYGTYATAEFAVTQTGKPVVSLTLNKSELSLLTGASETLIATVDPADAQLQWSSNKTSVASVDQNGKVTAVGNGTATISVAAGEKTTKCTVTVTTAVQGVSLNKTTLKLYAGKSETLVATINPPTASNQSVTWTSSNPSAATVDQSGKVEAIIKGTSLITVKTVDGGYTATCTVTIANPVPTGAVDLGLSVYWATSNLNTSGLCANPQDYGAYYAWGETATKSIYSRSTYKWCNGSITSLTRYCPSGKTDYWGGSGNPDNKTSFKDYDYADDAARKVLGGKWRTPTDEEWTELRNKCTWAWTDNYNGTGVKGRVVTASNGNSIFLPAAGHRDDVYFFSTGSGGYYWSSSLYTDDPRGAWYVYFTSANVYRDRDSRYLGQSVRPVSE